VNDEFRLHRLALTLRRLPFVKTLYVFLYKLGERRVISIVKKASAKVNGGAVLAVYLRRGGGRAETVPGASDLDFFLVLEDLSSNEEMNFLKNFWQSFRYWKTRFFPFLGETLMATELELENWLATPTVRSFEAPFSWKLLYGDDVLARLPKPTMPELRDVYSECLKCYWVALQPIIKMDAEKFSKNLRSNDAEAIRLRNAAKALVDLFRIHRSFGQREAISSEELSTLWHAGRVDLLSLLPDGNFKPLKNLLLLEDPIFTDVDPFKLFISLMHRALFALEETAELLQEKEGEEFSDRTHYKVVTPNQKRNVDFHSLAVRELFAERMLFRYKHLTKRAILSEVTTHAYFPLHKMPTEAELEELIADLRDVSFSFDKFSVAMPITERAFQELEKTSFLDSPFHSFSAHQEIQLGETDNLEVSAYSPRSHDLPDNMMKKTFAEISLALRFQPPQDFHFLIERLVTLVLSLRVASEFKEVVTDFSSALEAFSHRYPLRSGYLKQQMAPYFHTDVAAEDALWGNLFSHVDGFARDHGLRGGMLRTELETLARRRIPYDQLNERATSLWIELTPFLRMEMKALQDRFFEKRARLKI
jgi:hypothetical protein